MHSSGPPLKSCLVDLPTPSHIKLTDEGNLVSTAEAESLGDDAELSDGSILSKDVNPKEELGPGKRKRTANKLYDSAIFWRHHDDDDGVTMS